MTKEKQEKEKTPVKRRDKEVDEVLVRIMNKDIPGSKNIYSGLRRIKGVSWSISNIVCVKLGLERTKRISELSAEEIKKIEEFLKNFDTFKFLKNRQNDFDSGEDKHLLNVDLDLKKEFDIKRLKKIKSYRGMRHSLKLPTRGQRTRSNFRRGGLAVGVRKKKAGKKG